jgi:dTDP-4-dehydrorhamnose 3,5-epimerase
VRVVRGAIFDVAVDIRRSSPTFGRWVSLELSAERWNQILIPRGFAHGFVTLAEDTEVIYKVTEGYSPAHDRSIRFDDPEIGVDWPRMEVSFQLSDKDRNAPLLSQAETFE